MKIACPACAKTYRISPKAIGVEGRGVVCAACETRWFVEGKQAPHVDEPAPLGVETTAAQSAIDEKPSDVDQALGDDVLADRNDLTSFWNDDGALVTGPRAVSAREALSAPRRVRTGSQPKSAASSGWRPVAVGFVCLALAMGLVAKRSVIVRAVPRTAVLYAAIGLPVNVRSLEFVEVTMQRSAEADNSAEISGTIRNIASARTRVPKITFDIRDAKGATLYSWTEGAPKRVLAGDERLAFSSHMPSLPEGTKDVVVRFDDDPAPTAPSTLLIQKPH